MKSRCAVIITDSAGRQVYGLHSEEADRLAAEGRSAPFTVLGIPYNVKIIVDDAHAPSPWVSVIPMWILKIYYRRRRTALQL